MGSKLWHWRTEPGSPEINRKRDTGPGPDLTTFNSESRDPSRTGSPVACVPRPKSPDYTHTERGV